MTVRISREKRNRGLLVLLVCFLTMYAPIELSRVIVNWGLAVEFIFELVFMWLFYGLAVLIISIVIQGDVIGRLGSERGRTE